MVPRYIEIIWQRDLGDEPVRTYGEIGPSDRLIRRVEVYRHGQMSPVELTAAARGGRSKETPPPSLELPADPSAGLARAIDSAEFEAVWDLATRLSRPTRRPD